jgi:hypothetical protein
MVNLGTVNLEMDIQTKNYQLRTGHREPVLRMFIYSRNCPSREMAIVGSENLDNQEKL